MNFLPNPAPATLRGVLIRVDPVKPSRGDPHTLQREPVLLGFRMDGGRPEAVLLTPAQPDELVVIADTSGRTPTWTFLDAPTRDGRWQLDRWADVIDEVMHRHAPTVEAPELKVEPTGSPPEPVSDDVGNSRPRPWRGGVIGR
jgi:hypothetical protein